jgi:hypothetical protein
MTQSAALQQFVDDELMRAPLVAQQVIEDTVLALTGEQSSMTPAERSQAVDLAQVLRAQSPRIVATYAESLREQARAVLAGRDTPARSGTARASGTRIELALVDEDAISSDVHISHTTEAIKSVAEHELRELATFTSALVGDMDVTRDHNPVRAESHARALWAAAQQLTQTPAFPALFMRHAAQPLARVLRKAFAAACTRLDDAGVEPAAYRTLILPTGTRTERTGTTLTDQALRAIGEQFASVAGGGGGTGTGGGGSAPMAAPPSPPPLELLIRLFDFVLADKRLPRDVSIAIARLQSSAMRVALRDTSLLERYDHPVWEFINGIAWQAELLPPPPHPERVRALDHVESLIDHITGESEPEAGLYRWALDRLAAFERHRLDRRTQLVGTAELAVIEQRLAHASAPVGQSMGTLDVGQLDTVPAELLDNLPRSPGRGRNDEDWLGGLQAADVARLFLQGQWVQAQLLWRGDLGEVWLWADCHSDATWPVRLGALRLLHAEGLATPVKQRSLVREATELIAAQMARSRRS